MKNAGKSFDFACKQASKCRHERYQISCFSCLDHSSCEIQERLEKARKSL